MSHKLLGVLFVAVGLKLIVDAVREESFCEAFAEGHEHGRQVERERAEDELLTDETARPM